LALCCVVFASACGGNGVDADTTSQPGEIAIDLKAQDAARLAGARALLKYKNERQTRIVVDGFDSGEQSATRARLMNGTCSEPGQVPYALSPMRKGISDSVLDVPMPDLLESGYSIQVLEGPSQSDKTTLVACGELPETAPGS